MRKITDAQVKVLRRWLQRKGSLKLAALKAGLDRKTARKYREGAMASERRLKHRWRTRPDPLTGVWPGFAKCICTTKCEPGSSGRPASGGSSSPAAPGAHP